MNPNRHPIARSASCAARSLVPGGIGGGAERFTGLGPMLI
jgi:hypothetical protein